MAEKYWYSFHYITLGIKTGNSSLNTQDHHKNERNSEKLVTLRCSEFNSK